MKFKGRGAIHFLLYFLCAVRSLRITTRRGCSPPSYILYLLRPVQQTTIYFNSKTAVSILFHNIILTPFSEQKGQKKGNLFCHN
nr:MAG TPA: hypothetical protein [Caudoviricetes sp.]